MYAFLFFPTPATCRAHHTVLDFINRIIPTDMHASQPKHNALTTSKWGETARGATQPTRHPTRASVSVCRRQSGCTATEVCLSQCAVDSQAARPLRSACLSVLQTVRLHGHWGLPVSVCCSQAARPLRSACLSVLQSGCTATEVCALQQCSAAVLSVCYRRLEPTYRHHPQWSNSARRNCEHVHCTAAEACCLRQ
jgi:hypothetical protein